MARNRISKNELNENLQLEFEEYTTHMTQDVLSEEGVHGIRYFNDKLEIKNSTDWSEIEIGKANARGTQSLSPYHAIRRFPVFNSWANDTTAESLWMVMKDVGLNGQFIVRGSIGSGVTTSNAGGFEYSIDVFRLQGSTSNMTASLNILHYSDYMSSRFNVHNQSTKTDTKQPVLPITKRQYSAALYIEIEYISANTDAFEVLDSIEFQLQPPQSSPSTAPQLKSIFEGVKQVNDKVDSPLITLNPIAPIKANPGNITFNKVGNLVALYVNISGNTQLNAGTQYQICDDLPVGYRPRDHVFGLLGCLISSVWRTLNVYINPTGMVLMTNLPVNIPANTTISGCIVFPTNK